MTRDEYKRDRRLLASYIGFLAFTGFCVGTLSTAWMAAGLTVNMMAWAAAVTVLSAELRARRREEQAKEVPHAGGVGREN